MDLRKNKGIKKISQFHGEEDTLLFEQGYDAVPQLLKIEVGKGSDFLEKIESLREFCKENRFFFDLGVGERRLIKNG